MTDAVHLDERARPGAGVALDDKYRLEQGRAYMTGVQALTRLPMLQRERDRAAGLNTAGYVSGYRGSPIGALDMAMHEARPFLDAHDVRFHPGLNEDLAATAIWGSQQLHLLPGARRDGIFSMWYGKGPGVDRCGDVFKHANNAGTAPHGGVLVVAGDDHVARSSATAHQSEHIFSACGIPVLAPASVQEILDFGQLGWAMSRYSGCWVALKLSADIVESAATVTIDPARVQVQLPTDFTLPPDGVHIRWPDPQLAQERRLQAHRIYAAAAFARANGIDRLVHDAPNARLGLVACGKAWLELQQALQDLGIDAARADELGLRIVKVGMPWPLEAAGARRFARGLREILVIEEKRQIIEYQLKEMLYDWPDGERPRVVGKFDETGEWPAPPHQWLLPPTGELTPALIGRAILDRLARLDGAARPPAPAAPRTPPPMLRPPYFCPGCPHNRSTKVPEGSCALAGVGCHLMVVGMERQTLTISQMGGEGVTWLGMAEHAGPGHVFANMGDGTYYHSGLLAIRAAVAARVNITYKLLYNDAVAMTGGQPVDGPLTVPMLTRQLAAEGVARIVVVADDPGKYAGGPSLADGVRIEPRERLDAVQRELRALPGTTVLVFDQVCATESRRRRKRAGDDGPGRHVFINEAVCEGCGDCALQSNCLAVVPVETEFGLKRRIDPETCNLDLGCLQGRCPALVTVEGVRLRRGQGLAPWPEAPPEPTLPSLAQPFSLLIAGVGGTGVVTLGALLGMAAHLEGKAATVLDQTGLAQKGGAVLSHVRIAAGDNELHAPRVARADLLLGCELLVAAAPDTLQRVQRGHTKVLLNTAPVITGEYLRHPERGLPTAPTLALLRDWAGATDELDATRLATALVGHPIAANLFLLGVAWQRGLLPLREASLRRAIELNGVAVADNLRAFDWGRRAGADLQRAVRMAAEAGREPPSHRRSATLAEAVQRRRDQLLAYQDEALAQRYEALVERVRQAEQGVQPGSELLARTVAEQAFRLLAFKDDYEVARLFAEPAFTTALAATFEGEPKLHYHLTMPWQRHHDHPPKRRFGPWIGVVLRWLAAARRLRGSALDPLAASAERREADALVVTYLDVVDRLLRGLDGARLAQAATIAALPSTVRGYGVVRRQNAQRMLDQLAPLLADYERAGRPATASTARAVAA